MFSAVQQSSWQPGFRHCRNKQVTEKYNIVAIYVIAMISVNHTLSGIFCCIKISDIRAISGPGRCLTDDGAASGPKRAVFQVDVGNFDEADGLH